MVDRDWHANLGGNPRVCEEPTTGAVVASIYGVVLVRDACLNFPVLFSLPGGNFHKERGSSTGAAAPPGEQICRWRTTWLSVPFGESEVCAYWPSGEKKCGVANVIGGQTTIVNL